MSDLLITLRVFQPVPSKQHELTTSLLIMSADPHPAGRYLHILGENYGRSMNQHKPNRK